MKELRTQKGFTLIELIMVIVIIGILAASALPRYYDLITQARNASADGTSGGVRAGAATWHAWSLVVLGNDEYPPVLDYEANTICSVSKPFFVSVLDSGITDGQWTKAGQLSGIYSHANEGVFTYDPADGSFEQGIP